jgi:hypothetical protein
MPTPLQELKQQHIDLSEKRQAILDSAAGDGRALNPSESLQLRELKAQLADLRAQITEMEEKETAARERIRASLG